VDVSAHENPAAVRKLTSTLNFTEVYDTLSKLEGTARHRVPYRRCIGLLLKFPQPAFHGQVSRPRVPPQVPNRDLGFVIEIKHECEDFFPFSIGIDPRETPTPLNIDFASLHIDHIRKEFHIFVGQGSHDNIEVILWLREFAADEWRESGYPMFEDEYWVSGREMRREFFDGSFVCEGIAEGLCGFEEVVSGWGARRGSRCKVVVAARTGRVSVIVEHERLKFDHLRKYNVGRVHDGDEQREGRKDNKLHGWGARGVKVTGR